MPREKMVDAGSAAFPARKRDMGMKGAPLGLQHGRLAGALDLCIEGFELLLRPNPGPKRAVAMLFKPADTVQGDRKLLAADTRQRSGQILANRPFDFPDEAQGQMQLLLMLPTQVGQSFHQVEQPSSNGFRRADGDEQPVHRHALPVIASEAKPSNLDGRVTRLRLLATRLSCFA